MALAISSREGSGDLSSRCFVRTMMPGMQKPHCMPAAATKASVICARSASLRPSRVRISWPAALLAGMAQVVTARPPTMARQHPHWPWGEQPSLVD